MGVILHVSGEKAVFPRPECRVDLVTYDLLTPHSARGVLDKIYRRPGMNWVIDSVRVIKPIVMGQLREVRRRVVILRDVEYIIEAHFELGPGEAGEQTMAMFRRAAAATPAIFLGRADFAGEAKLLDLNAEDLPFVAGRCHDYGWILHSIDFDGDRRPRFFRAVEENGVVRVPPADSPLLFK